jgi:DNA replication protein DnaC
MCGLLVIYIHAKEIYDLIKSDENKKLLITSALFIDELGRESLEINEFGNKIRPIQDLFAYRYEFGSRTFCTSNFSPSALEGKNDNGVQKGYGKYVRTRMEEMMNIIEMPGDNRRPSYTL